LYRLARVGAMAVRVLGSEEKAGRWLHRPNRALGNESPLSLLDTAIGAREVEDLLGRIEHGVVS
ncbi:MAG: antitoxin Xre/MbcA/ParS toxin-binding domain-containing protein, partial [Candidatus Binatia bacterium]